MISLFLEDGTQIPIKDFALDSGPNLQPDIGPWHNGLMATGMREVSAQINVLISVTDHTRRAFNRLLWTFILMDFHMFGIVRPDGRPRRTGKRHRGTRGWNRRYVTNR